MDDSRPLVWLPFDPDELGDPPSGLRYEVVSRSENGEAPASIDEVEFYVPVYGFRQMDAEMIAKMSRLKVVQTLTAGVEHIRSYVPDHVQLCNGRGIHATSTAELALALVLASRRGVPEFVRAQDRGVWEPERRRSLADSRVLIVGYGDIGRAIEERLLPFEVEVVRVARTARDGVHGFEDLPDLVPEADVVVLICPLTDQTRGLVDADFLARMKDDALLVNVARGQVVDTDALVEALADRRIHAALDVVDPEPLPEGHPLWSSPNLLLVPHVGGASTAMTPRAHSLLRAQLARFAAGEPLENVMSGDY